MQSQKLLFCSNNSLSLSNHISRSNQDQESPIDRSNKCVRPIDWTLLVLVRSGNMVGKT